MVFCIMRNDPGPAQPAPGLPRPAPQQASGQSQHINPIILPRWNFFPKIKNRGTCSFSQNGDGEALRSL